MTSAARSEWCSTLRVLGAGKLPILADRQIPFRINAGWKDIKRGCKQLTSHFDPQLLENAQPTTDGGRAAAAALLKRQPDVDAIFAFNDLMAVGAMQVCLELGKKVPQDIAIIGVDDIPLATIIRPQLTTMHVALSHIGRLAMRALLDIINGEGTAGCISDRTGIVHPRLSLKLF